MLSSHTRARFSGSGVALSPSSSMFTGSQPSVRLFSSVTRRPAASPAMFSSSFVSRPHLNPAAFIVGRGGGAGGSRSSGLTGSGMGSTGRFPSQLSVRCLFGWGGGKDDDDDGSGDDAKKGKKKQQAEKEADADDGGEVDIEDGSSGSDRGRKGKQRRRRIVSVEDGEVQGDDDGEGDALDASRKPSGLTPLSKGEKAPRPPQVLALPSLNRPLFPGFMMPLTLTDDATMHALVELKNNNNPWVGVFLGKQDADSSPSEFTLTDVDQLHRTGVLGYIQNTAVSPDGLQVMILAHRRIRITDLLSPGPPLHVQVHHIDNPPDSRSSPTVKAFTNEILATIREIIRLNPMFKEHVQYFMQTMDLQDSWRLADFAASLTTASGPELQQVLEADDLEMRLNLALVLLKKEKELSQLQQDINREVEQRISKTNRTYFLQEQLKSIKKELGVEKDDKDALLQKFKDRAATLAMPETAKTVFNEELEKLEMLERNSAEFNVTRSYLDWLTSIPWGVFSEDNLDIERAQQILDEDHYGLADVKERILEFIAVGKLKGSVQGKIVCMVGPPGVGKTSIGKSMARALDREFYRFSVGGLSDVAEIKGHRRTYVGAMPGKLIQCMKSTGVSNPLVLIDEIDKIGTGRHSGDPASALLEMLDPNQNSTFMDHYLDTPVDASKVLFVCTANVLETIPGPLLDRMEIIRLSGYDGPEKLEIAQRYLEPKLRSELGLGPELESTPESLSLQSEAIQDLIRWYCRESGVRNLEKHIEKLYRKVALKIAKVVEAAAAEKVKTLPPPEPETITPEIVAPSSPSLDAAMRDVLRREVDDDKKSDGGETNREEEEEEEDSLASSDGDGDGDDSVGEGEDVDVDPTEKNFKQRFGVDLSREEIFGEEDGKWSIGPEDLEEYVGKKVYTSDRLYKTTPPGVIMGLAWTQMGGSALYIEVTTPNPRERVLAKADKMKEEDGEAHGGRLKLTGQLGDVMQESASIAHTVSRRVVKTVDPDNAFLDVAAIHMHVPEGATPKDGPSAGCTMVTAMLSLALDRPVRSNLAMTGEVTLGGMVLPVGGIKEKTMAARRSGVTTLIFPIGCKKDFDELPDHLREGLTVHFAETYDDVFEHAFDPVE